VAVLLYDSNAQTIILQRHQWASTFLVPFQQQLPGEPWLADCQLVFFLYPFQNKTSALNGTGHFTGWIPVTRPSVCQSTEGITKHWQSSMQMLTS